MAAGHDTLREIRPRSKARSQKLPWHEWGVPISGSTGWVHYPSIALSDLVSALWARISRACRGSSAQAMRAILLANAMGGPSTRRARPGVYNPPDWLVGITDKAPTTSSERRGCPLWRCFPAVRCHRSSSASAPTQSMPIRRAPSRRHDRGCWQPARSRLKSNTGDRFKVPAQLNRAVPDQAQVKARSQKLPWRAPHMSRPVQQPGSRISTDAVWRGRCKSWGDLSAGSVCLLIATRHGLWSALLQIHQWRDRAVADPVWDETGHKMESCRDEVVSAIRRHQQRRWSRRACSEVLRKDWVPTVEKACAL